jgi:hypothetical protein
MLRDIVAVAALVELLGVVVVERDVLVLARLVVRELGVELVHLGREVRVGRWRRFVLFHDEPPMVEQPVAIASAAHGAAIFRVCVFIFSP